MPPEPIPVKVSRHFGMTFYPEYANLLPNFYYLCFFSRVPMLTVIFPRVNSSAAMLYNLSTVGKLVYRKPLCYRTARTMGTCW